jgi:hypothetical protein
MEHRPIDFTGSDRHRLSPPWTGGIKPPARRVGHERFSQKNEAVPRFFDHFVV